MHFVGGEPDATLAMKTANELFTDKSDKSSGAKAPIQLIFHVRQTPLSPKTKSEIQHLGHSESIAVIDFPQPKWKLLGTSTPSFWANQLCLVGSLIDQLNKQQPEKVQPIPANINEVFFTSGPDSSPLPTDSNGQVLLVGTQPTSASAKDETTARILPTDEAGQYIYPVVNQDGQLLPTDSSGRYVDALGEPVRLDDYGRPIGEDRQLLPVNQQGQYVFNQPSQEGLLLPVRKAKPQVIGPDGIPMPTDTSGNYVDRDQQPIPTNAQGILIDAQSGEPLPTNSQGQVVVGGTGEEVGRTLPTDDTGRFIYPLVYKDTGKPVRTDESGRYVDVLGEPIATDDFGRPVDAGGQLLPTNRHGQYVYSQPDEPLKVKPTKTAKLQEATTKKVVVIGPDGVPQPTDYQGKWVDAEGRALPTNPQDASGLPIYPILNSDGQALPTDATGRHLDGLGEPIPLDELGHPLDKEDGQVLPTNSQGQYVYTSPPTKVPIVVIGPDGQPMPTDTSGRIVDKQGSPYPTNYDGLLLGPDGSPLPTNEDGQLLVTDGDQEDSKAVTLPTDDYGKLVYPIVHPNGHALPQDQSGRYVDPQSGEPIPIDDFGKPLDPEGKPLPTNRKGEYIYRSPKPAVIGMIGPDGLPLPTDTSGRMVDKQGSPYPTNPQGLLVGPDGSPLPTDSDGQVIVPSATTSAPYQEDGLPLPRNSEGRYLTAQGELIPIDDYGRPLDQEPGEEDRPIGNVLPTNELGQYVYKPKAQEVMVAGSEEELDQKEPTQAGVLPTDGGHEPVEVLGPDGQLLDRGLSTTGNPLSRIRNQSDHCFITGFIEVMLVFDTSNNVKILDYRLMKEAVKLFLSDHFDLRPNRVRVGLLKYGEDVDVPVALGDYDAESELMARIGETRRMKGDVVNLDKALRETTAEFLLSGAERAPKVVIIWKNGNATGDVRNAAEILRNELEAKVFVITVGGKHPEDLLLVGEENSDRIIQLKQWRGAEGAQLGGIADKICESIPQAKTEDTTVAWPIRKTTPTTKMTTTGTRSCSVIDYEVDMVITLDSSNFDAEQFSKIIEGVGTLVDESFDLAPDVVRIGFVVYR
uniref:VWFA domain-containing protein n=1 Tax=Ditylenchus dipsaci TaxID=166011 RepID=A0A915EPK2_9BILA